MPKRKNIRLKDYDYSSNGAYFVTICVKNRHQVLGEIVGGDDLGAPSTLLSEYGQVVEKYIENIKFHYDVTIDKYIIMPNHIHLIIVIKNGVPGSSRPTMLIPRIVTAIKKLTNKEYGFNLWQTSYHDHIIRDEVEYQKIWSYIDTNPDRWTEDKYYTS